MLAGQHGVAVLFEVGGAGEIDKQRQRLPGDAVLAVVDVQVADGQRELAATGGIFVEKKLAEVFPGDLVVVATQRVPFRRSGNVSSHSFDPSVTR